MSYVDSAATTNGDRPFGQVSVTPRQLQVLFGLLRVYGRAGRVTMREICDELGWSRNQVNTVWREVQVLKRVELVAQDHVGSKAAGTLRPLVWPVKTGA